VYRGQLGAVAQLPAQCGEIHCQQLFFTAEVQDRAEATRGLEGAFAHHRRTRQESEHRRPGQTGTARQRAGGQHARHRVLAITGPHHGPGCDQPDVRLRIEDFGGPRYRVSGPPRIIIAERDIRSSAGGDADISGHGTEVRPERKHTEPVGGLLELTHSGNRTVTRMVVDHDDRTVRRLQQSLDDGSQFALAITCGDHEREFLFGALVHNGSHYPPSRTANPHG